MTISKPSQLSLDNMMSSQEVSPAKIFQWPVEEKELQNNPDQVSFTPSCESYAWYDQDSLSWKTWQRSLITDWTSFSESFPKQGTMQNGQLYLQVHWEPPTDVQGGGVSQLLPTPTARGLQREVFSKMESGIWSAKHTGRLDPNWRSYVSKPILLRGSYGLSYRVDRTKALGNSIVPAVAAIPLQRVHDLYYK